MQALKQISPTHYVSDNKGHYSIYMILKYITEFKIKAIKVSLSFVKKFMYEEKWYSPLDKRNISPLDVLTNKKKYIDEFNRILAVDLKYPIILDSKGGFIDGAHRIAKSFLEQKYDIMVYYLDFRLLKYFRLTKKKIDNLKNVTYAQLDMIYKSIDFASINKKLPKKVK